MTKKERVMQKFFEDLLCGKTKGKKFHRDMNLFNYCFNVKGIDLK